MESDQSAAAAGNTADWAKTDIIKYLADLKGYRSYLEICTTATGHKFAEIDRSKFDRCHRLMYRCPENFTDGLNIDFRVAGLDSRQCVADIHRRNLRYDIILVDPWHEYATSYRDLTDALSLVTDNGSIVVHDCLPPTEETVSPTWVPVAWCGLTFMAYVDFVTRHDVIRYRTVDTDYGCGVIQKGRQSPNNRPSSALLESWKELSGDPSAAFRFLQDNKHELLQLNSIEEFIRVQAGAVRTG
jgi:hypothetical protein